MTGPAHRLPKQLDLEGVAGVWVPAGLEDLVPLLRREQQRTGTSGSPSGLAVLLAELERALRRATAGSVSASGADAPQAATSRRAPNHWISTGRAADFCGLTPRRMRQLALAGFVGALPTDGGHWRWDPDRLRRVIEQAR